MLDRLWRGNVSQSAPRNPSGNINTAITQRSLITWSPVSNPTLPQAIELLKGSSTSHMAATPEAPRLVLIRGLPGSGKSTTAKVLALIGYEHYEADMFFVRDGRYVYDASRIRDAHAWCQHMTRQALAQEGRVVVSNTFTRLNELAPYLDMSDSIRVIEAQGNWKNVHDVPPQAIARMAQRWEVLPTSLTIATPTAIPVGARALPPIKAPSIAGHAAL